MAIPPFSSPPTPSATTSLQGKIQLAGDLTGTAALPTIKADVGLTGNPTATTQSAGDNSNKIATDAFVTGAIATAIAGVNPAVAVQVATAAILPNSPTYNNGVAGIGAFLTTATLNTALVVDGYTPTLNERVLVKNQGSTFQNGVYFVSQLAAIGLAWILTRALDYDMPSDMNNTGAIPVTKGTVNIDTQWVLTSQVTTVGTDPLTYTQFSLNPSTILTNGLTSAHIFVGNSSNVATDTAMTGDVSITNTGATALATVNANTGSFGTATQVPTINFDGKGRATSVSNTSIQITESQVTNLTTDLAGKQATGNYITALTGDVTAAGPGSVAGTLATVNSNVGTFGSTTQSPQITVNGKGLITAVSNVTIIEPDIALSLMSPTTDETITAGYSAVIADWYEIQAGKTLDIQALSVLHLT